MNLRLYQPVILPSELRGYVKYIVCIHPDNGLACSMGIRHVCFTKGVSVILNRIGEQRDKRHKKAVHGHLCPSVVAGEICEQGFDCPNIHVTQEGYKDRREWDRPLRLCGYDGSDVLSQAMTNFSNDNDIGNAQTELSPGDSMPLYPTAQWEGALVPSQAMEPYPNESSTCCYYSCECGCTYNYDALASMEPYGFTSAMTTGNPYSAYPQAEWCTELPAPATSLEYQIAVERIDIDAANAAEAIIGVQEPQVRTPRNLAGKVHHPYQSFPATSLAEEVVCLPAPIPMVLSNQSQPQHQPRAAWPEPASGAASRSRFQPQTRGRRYLPPQRGGALSAHKVPSAIGHWDAIEPTIESHYCLGAPAKPRNVREAWDSDSLSDSHFGVDGFQTTMTTVPLSASRTSLATDLTLSNDHPYFEEEEEQASLNSSFGLDETRSPLSSPLHQPTRNRKPSAMKSIHHKLKQEASHHLLESPASSWADSVEGNDLMDFTKPLAL